MDRNDLLLYNKCVLIYEKEEIKSMLNDKNSYDYGNRNLSDVFKELQEMQNHPNVEQDYFEESKEIKVNRNYSQARKLA